jgi:1-phosphatidylinositol-4-phosphate 5-kinase
MLTSLQYGLIKRIEHFLKSIGRNEAEISAIPPDRYGDRFIHFIAGNTMSKELAALRSEEQPTLVRPSQSAPAAAVNDISASPTALTQQKADNAIGNAEREAARSPTNVRHPGEQGVPDRSLGTVQSPAPPGRGGEKGEGSATLPVVEEAAESNSARSSVGPTSRSNSPGEAKGLAGGKRLVEGEAASGFENGKAVEGS